LITSAGEQLSPGVEVDPDDFEVAFYLGRPAPIRRPLWDVAKVDGEWQPHLDLDVSHTTTPALIAAVGLAGSDPVPPAAPSIVRPGTGLGLVTTATMMAARLAVEKAATEGTQIEGVTVDRLDVVTTDYGFDIDGEAHATGAELDFAGSLVARFVGGVGGQLVLRSTIETDVDRDWWADVLSALAALVPGLGWILGEIFIWGPEREAPEKVENALLDRFTTPLAAAAQQLAGALSLPLIPTDAYLADVWFVDGNLCVAAAAFAGRISSEVRSVFHDVAYVAADPAGEGKHANRRRPVKSVGDITLASGHTLKPWQAGRLVRDELVRIPGHHAVSNPLARGGVYLRSNPDDTTSNNLLGA
ncbi:MAG TPA: hypothetical protein VMM13_10435, partial [Euzebya sp.]|nr:hypothetical protein [Euzebya sp.]